MHRTSRLPGATGCARTAVKMKRSESDQENNIMASVQETLQMVSGDGDTSYARNSVLQAGEQGNIKPMIEEAVANLLDGSNRYPGGMMIADLGCSSGPNTLVLVSTAVDAVRRRCMQLQQQPPEICINLNDLQNNDFNSVIKSLNTYKQTQEGSGLILTSIVPGSFYGRLFNKCSLHLVCSTCSLHWISKAPEDLVRNGIPCYDSDEVARRARRSTVMKAYGRQFNQDFTQFLGLRAQEMVRGGQMVFSILGQRYHDEDDAIGHVEFIAHVLHEMSSMGLIDQEKLDSFYVPVYGPSPDELRVIIEAEGSFSVTKIAVHEPTICVGRGITTAKTMAQAMRAAMEPMIVQHFGSSPQVMDEFVLIAEKLMKYPNKPGVFLAASLVRT